ncbi:Alpha/Beta hydrolase protein [Xylariales sp. PMI_506]|nr:Alpha/Beta hydrolase protein [Xylariales sp. PMI_506]
MGSPDHVNGPDRPQRQQSLKFTVLLSVTGVLVAFQAWSTLIGPSGWWAANNSGRRTDGDALPQDDTVWRYIAPSRELAWHSCYDGVYECARLDVPMDWLDPSDDQRVTLAVIKLPAADREDYRGPVFFNPGGPGGSGVHAMKDRGREIQRIIGRNYDLIAWDPRGIAASVPRIDCWGGSAEKAQLWAARDVGVVGAHPGTLNDAFARAVAYSQVCEQSAEGSDLLRHIGTPSNARDLLELVDLTGAGKLRYWGFSYGTLLGGTFASLWPERVERLVSDGNVDYREWYLQTHVNFLRDADNVMAAFYDFCSSVGPARCAFHEEDPALIKHRLAELLETIRLSPIIVPISLDGPDMPRLITWSDMKQFINSALYQPIFIWPKFAEILAALEAGNGLPFYKLRGGNQSTSSICSGEPVDPRTPLTAENTDDSTAAVMCSDRVLLSHTVDDLSKVAQYYDELSSTTGAVNMFWPLGCVGRVLRPKWEFSGPFEGNTSHPILYINNMADNITPLASARNNSQGFPSSVLLVQNSYGHTTLAAASSCTAGYIRAYFQTGELPTPGTHCEPDHHPFEDFEASTTDELGIASYELAARSASHILELGKDLVDVEEGKMLAR